MLQILPPNLHKYVYINNEHIFTLQQNQIQSQSKQLELLKAQLEQEIKKNKLFEEQLAQEIRKNKILTETLEAIKAVYE